MTRVTGVTASFHQTRPDCPMRPQCVAHQIRCSEHNGNGCGLSRYMDRIGWPDLSGSLNPPEADDVPPRGPWFKKSLRRFFANGRIVRTFRRAAPDQMEILIAFQEQGWPAWIENPFGRSTSADSERRLSNAVARLNHQQKPKRIYFWVEKGTQRIYWKLIDENGD